MDRGAEIMVVGRDTLLGARPFQGFSPAGAYDYESLILKNYRYTPRQGAENNPELKQPIAYCMIVNPAAERIFVYRRATGEGDYGEERLRGKWSIGIGGHIDRADLSAANPIRASMLRELGEELVWEGQAEPRLIGYINDDIDMVGKVHFGLLYRLDTAMHELTPRGREIEATRMVTCEALEGMLQSGDYRMEGWTRIASGPLREDLALGRRRGEH